MSGQIKSFDRYMDSHTLYVSNPNPYELPKPLRFNLRKAVAYAKEHSMEVRDIPATVLRKL